MRQGGAGLIIAALLALAGCKSLDPKGDDKAPSGLGANRPKTKDGKEGKDTKGALTKGPTWLDNVDKYPSTGVPKSTGPTNPKDPNFDAKTAAQDALGGRVLDPNGKPARNIYVRIEPVSGPAGPGEVGIYTNDEGYFFSTGFKPGISYELTASATPQDGKPLTGTVQTKVPNAILLIHLRDDLPPAAGFPPAPKPADKVGDYIPPMGYAPINQPKPPGDAWSPGGPTNAVPPTTIGGAKPPAVSGGTPGGALPPPETFVPSPAPKPVRPESTADGPKDPYQPPPVSIPGPGTGGGPPIPPLPTPPPTFNPTSGGRSSLGTGAERGAKFTLLDTLERPWDSDSVSPGSLVLVEFMTTSCKHCPAVIPVLKDLQSRYGASGLQVVGVLCDDLPQGERAQTASKYGRDYNLNYAVYVEPGKAGTVRDRLGVESYPWAVLIDSTGRVVWRGHPGERAKLEAAVKQGLGK